MTDRLECVWVKRSNKRYVYVNAHYAHNPEGRDIMAYVVWWDKRTSLPNTWAVTVRNPTPTGFGYWEGTNTTSGFTHHTNTDTLDDAKNVAQLICASTLETFTGVSK